MLLVIYARTVLMFWSWNSHIQIGFLFFLINILQFNYSSGQPAPESITEKIYGNTLSVRFWSCIPSFVELSHFKIVLVGCPCFRKVGFDDHELLVQSNIVSHL